VVQAILGLPEQAHVSVKATGIKLIGELCEWLNKHPQFIGSLKTLFLLQLLFLGFYIFYFSSFQIQKVP
jgi:transportin-3